MANPYPADIQDGAGNVRISGKVNFTDPDNQPGGGGAQTLAQTLALGNNAASQAVTGLGAVTLDGSGDLDVGGANILNIGTGTAVVANPLTDSLDAGGNAITNVAEVTGTGSDFDTGGGTMKTSGGDLDLGGAKAKGFDDPATGTDGVPRDWANAHVGGAALVSASEGQVPVVSSGAIGFSDLTIGFPGAPPSGAPVAGQLPFAWDSTAVTGGFYFWNGAAWTKIVNIA